MKPKKCRCGCGVMFTPRNSMQIAATPECAIAIAKARKAREAKQQEKVARKAVSEARDRLKTRSDWMREAQAAVNAYVRVRDANLGCVSCNKDQWWHGQWHASHFKSVGANSFLRFNLWNIHKACSVCNNHLSGNIGEYAKRLPDRIGVEKFAFLENAPRSKTYTIEYLKRLRDIFRKKTKLYLKRRMLR